MSTTYTVVQGDTGTTIAQKFAITLQQLEDANPGVNWNDLQIGQTLNIPGPTTTYTVVEGDTGTTIAAKLGITLQQLEDANPGVNWNDLQIGQILNVPA
jgi:N-acetylmuramoyl-L-alanine amidase